MTGQDNSSKQVGKIYLYDGACMDEESYLRHLRKNEHMRNSNQASRPDEPSNHNCSGCGGYGITLI